MRAPTDRRGFTAQERRARRQSYIDAAINQAKELGRTGACRNRSHDICVGETPGGAGCLCECHDPAGPYPAEPVPDRYQPHSRPEPDTAAMH